MRKTELSGALDWIGARKGWLALGAFGILILLLVAIVMAAPGAVQAVEAPVGEVGAPGAFADVYPTLTPYAYIPMVEKGFSEYEIAFFSNRGATKDNYTLVYLMDSGGSNQHSLVGNPPTYEPAAQDDKFEWRPAYGDVIVYPRLYEGSNSYTDLFVAKADGTGTIQLTSNSGVSEYVPTWSKGPGAGNEIAFVSNKDGNWDIYKINYTGSVVVPNLWDNLTDNSYNNWGPQWSPTGSKIAYLSSQSGSLQVWVMDTNGGGKTRLTSYFWSSGTFCWSPDSTKIAYDYYHNGEYRVDVVSAVSGSTPPSIHLTGTDCWGPAWSPDGETIAYHKWIGFIEIYARDSNGYNERQLTHDYHDSRFPNWSPDSEYIAYSQNHVQEGYYWEIYMMPADGSYHTRLTYNPAEDKFPAFLPVEN